MPIKSIDALTLLSRVRSRSPVLSEVYSRVLGKPLLAESEEAIRVFVESILFDRFDPEDFDIPGEAALLERGVIDAVRTPSGTAGVIDISGPLASRAAFCGPLSYDLIQADFRAALEAPEVDRIILRFNTPGGEADGCFELSDLIYQSRGVKPIISVIDPRSASAGYAIASAADTIVLGRTSGVGSVGVIMVHMDRSQMNKKLGLAFTYLTYGENKAAGNPDEPLSKEVEALFQSQIDELGSGFVELVARNRDMSVADVEALGANVFTGAKAIEVGLADELGSLVDLLEKEESTMTGKTKQPGDKDDFTGRFAAAVNALTELAVMGEAPPELTKLQEQLNGLLLIGSPSKPAEASKPEQPEQPAGEAVSAEALVTACAEAGHPALAATLLKRDLTENQLKEFLSRVEAVESAAKTLGLDGPKISALIDDPAAMVRMAISEHAETLDVNIESHLNSRSGSETAKESWDDAFAIATGKKRMSA